MDLTDLKDKSLDDLNLLARDCGITSAKTIERADLVIAIMRAHASKGQVRGSGILEVLGDGFGFLRSPDSRLAPGPDDIYVSPSQIRRFNLRTGDLIAGVVRPPKESERYYALLKVETINGLSPDERKKKLFDNLTAVYPTEPLNLEHDPADSMTRLIDLFAPIAKGQRVLLLSPPRAGKSSILRKIAAAVVANHSTASTVMLLVGERPEEITDMKRANLGEVIASGLDDSATKHVQVAERALEKAKRVAEKGGDAVLILDSISRLARAFAAGAASETHAKAVHQCRRFFGTARKLEEGGSLTIIAAANADANSPLDTAIETELVEAASTLIALDPSLIELRVHPPFDLARSESRDADRIHPPEIIKATSKLRRQLLMQDNRADAIETFCDSFDEHETNSRLVAAFR